MSYTEDFVNKSDSEKTTKPLSDEKVERGRSAKRARKGTAVLSIAIVIVVCAGIGFWVWHEQPSFCATVCHDTMGSYLRTYESSDYLVHRHAEAQISCLDCHEADVATQLQELQVQVSGTYRLPLAKADTDDAFCLRDGCHVRESIVEATSSFVAGNNESVNPHAITFSANYGSTESPHEVAGETIACATCHTAHRESAGIDYCYDSCHHTETFASCYSCHDHR